MIILFVAGYLLRIYSFNELYLPRIEDPYASVYWSKYIYYPTYNRLDGLLAGVSIAAIYVFLPAFWSRITRYGNLFILLSLVVFLMAYLFLGDPQGFFASVFGFTIVASGYGLMVVGALSPSTFLYKWKSKITKWIATLSYAIYLTHKGVIHITHELLGDFEINSTVLMLISMATCTLAALLVHFAVERPFLKLRQKIV